MKTVFISFLLHGNMCYDRYTKQVIREKFPQIYANGIRAMHEFPQVTAHIDFPGLTVLSLKQYAPWLLTELQPLVDREQIIMVGCQYAASHALCADEEADLLASKLSMDIMQAELAPDAHAFFPQEMAFHPQSPLIMEQIGVTRLIVSPGDWSRPRRTRSVSGSEVNTYPVVPNGGRPEQLEHLYDSHADGDFVLVGGDFEMLGNVAEYVACIAELAARGKVIQWTTVDRYEREVGTQQVHLAVSPFGHAADDRPASPSFSRWVSDPDDILWHDAALQALDALRTAGWASAAAALHELGSIDVPLTQAWTTEPDNPWDHYFEHVLEYPATETRYLGDDSGPKLLTRAWHQALIGLNSDASGWVPWAPRTRHRILALQSARVLATEVVERFAHQLAPYLPQAQANADYILALNPAPARTVEVRLRTDRPQALVESDGTPLAATVLRTQDGWYTHARITLPAYGYKLLALSSAPQGEVWHWETGTEVTWAGRTARLQAGTLTVCEGDQVLELSLAPFMLSDPTDIAAPEAVTPHWHAAQTRVRRTSLGCDLEIMCEVAWTIWLRLVIGLRADHIALEADLHVDMPRVIGERRFDPAGIMLEVRGQPGQASYDVPFATIPHVGADPAYVAVQRFAALTPDEPTARGFGLISLSGNQSYRLAASQGSLAVGLGASKRARPAERPECQMLPDGTARHLVSPALDPLYGSSHHRFALVWGQPVDVALTADRLRIAVPLVRVQPGAGRWPREDSLFAISPTTARVTAFRSTGGEVQVSCNDLSGQPGAVACNGHALDLPAFGYGTIRWRP